MIMYLYIYIYIHIYQPAERRLASCRTAGRAGQRACVWRRLYVYTYIYIYIYILLIIFIVFVVYIYIYIYMHNAYIYIYASHLASDVYGWVNGLLLKEAGEFGYSGFQHLLSIDAHCVCYMNHTQTGMFAVTATGEAVR